MPLFLLVRGPACPCTPSLSMFGKFLLLPCSSISTLKPLPTPPVRSDHSCQSEAITPTFVPPLNFVRALLWGVACL